MAATGDTGVTRKLASIVAVDVVGYSARAEADERAAVAAVTDVAHRIAERAGAYGGRVFSTAGDGFMLEFPTASAALDAAADLAKETALPLRVGVHVGEVSELANGDLLGHGVNIAARLQRLAKPGGVVVSEDVHRSARGSAAARLRPIGSFKLDKMSETLTLYSFDDAAKTPALAMALEQLRRRWRIVAAVVAALAVGLLSWWAVTRQGDVRTAVFTPAAPAGDAQLIALATAVSNEIVDTMNEIGIEALSRSVTDRPSSEPRLTRARRLGAAFLLDGDAARDADVVRVSIRLDDVRARQTLWSHTFEQPAAEADALRLGVAARTVHVMRCAAEARREMQRLDLELMRLLLRSCGEEPDDVDGFATLELNRRFAAALPRSSLAQARLAGSLMRASENAPDAMREEMRREALNAAELALRLNPANGRAAAVKAGALRTSLSRPDYEGALIALLRAAPDSAQVNTQYAHALRSVGRNEEALVYARRALANDPLSPFRVFALAWTLAIVDRRSDAWAVLERHAERWPGDRDIWWAQFRIALFFGPQDRIRTLMQHLPEDEAQCWGRVVDALAARRPQALPLEGACMDRAVTVQLLAALGDTDRAFAIVEEQLREEGTRAWYGMLFEPPTQSMRADPRFMPLMHRLGMIEYWREMDRWPDFCEAPGLPYDCRAEAARLAGQAPYR